LRRAQFGDTERNVPERNQVADEEPWTVFISWSGHASLGIAKVLRLWLRSLVQLVDPWISPDIAAGERWQATLSGKLVDAKYGILCVTRDNATAPWLIFEAGAMARSFDQSRVVPLLFGIDVADLTGPLSQFQSVVGDRTGIFKIVKELHAVTQSRMPDAELQMLFDTLWPSIEKGIAEACDVLVDQPLVARSDREILDEVLALVRGLRVAPSEDGITLALRLLEAEVNSELERLENEEERLTRADAPISLEDRAIEPLRQRVERIQTARRALDRNQTYVSAASTSIIWLADVVRAVERLHSDLQGRELALDLRNSRDTPLYNRILVEVGQCAELLDFIDKKLRHIEDPK
jgi:hypothetical protein